MPPSNYTTKSSFDLENNSAFAIYFLKVDHDLKMLLEDSKPLGSRRRQIDETTSAYLFFNGTRALVIRSGHIQKVGSFFLGIVLHTTKEKP